MGLHNTLVGLRGLIGPALGTWLYEVMGMRIASIYWIAFAIEVLGAVLLALFWAVSKRSGFSRRNGS
jgi:uncharacterized membrane protein YeaQ/YmgE (transglycosylase-associated protein family)